MTPAHADDTGRNPFPLWRSGYRDGNTSRRQPFPGMRDAQEGSGPMIGRTIRAIAEGCIPGHSTGESRAMESHETICVLNPNDRDAAVELTLYFTDREPAGPYRLKVPARRTHHFRFNDLSDPEEVPRDTDYANLLRSDVPVIVQHTRLDSRQAELALLSTVAFPVG